MDYVLPLKAGPEDDLADLGRYVERLSRHLLVIIVDGSDDVTYARNKALFTGATHVRPTERGCANGKVAGVVTGFRLCTSDKVVIADDDVRYQLRQLQLLERLLDDADVVSPQNYYDPMTLPARWDTARILINRALPSGDFPGTLALRLSGKMRVLGYDGDVLFENLELIRTVLADGGRLSIARGLFVRRLPPTTAHFVGQRVRQAYDSQAQPLRLLAELSLLPLGAIALRRPVLLGAAAAAVIAIAECGRRRSGAAAYFPGSSALLAPAWVAERAACAWVALVRRWAFGGTVYADRRIRRAASSVAALRRGRMSSCGCRRRTV